MADRRLQVFHAVAKYRSFTRAADALFMTQPAVTFQIRHLEEEVNTRLFERRHGGIDLTPAGELMFGYAEKILGLTDEMDKRLGEMTGEMRGELTVGAIATVAEIDLPNILSEFNALYPQVRVRLIVGNTETLEQRVASHELDVALVGSPPRLAGLTGVPAHTDPFLVVCAPDHPLASQDKVSAATLADYEFLSREPGSGTREVVRAYFQAQGIDPEQLKTQMELGSHHALKGVVLTGLGYALMPLRTVRRETERGELVTIPLDPPLNGTIHFVYPEDRYQTRLTATFIDFSRRKMKYPLS